MRTEDRVLELVKEKPLLMSELRERLQVSTVDMMSVLAFLQKYKLVEIINLDVSDGDGMVWINPKGLQLLNLPDLPEGELPSNQLEVLEQHWGDEIDEDPKQLYTPEQHAETTEGITDMAIRFDVRGNDVIRALWIIAKDSVWAKLEQDLKEKKRRK